MQKKRNSHGITFWVLNSAFSTTLCISYYSPDFMSINITVKFNNFLKIMSLGSEESEIQNPVLFSEPRIKFAQMLFHNNIYGLLFFILYAISSTYTMLFPDIIWVSNTEWMRTRVWQNFFVFIPSKCLYLFLSTSIFLLTGIHVIFLHAGG